MSTTLTKDKLKHCQISPFVTRIPQTIPSPKSHRPPTEVSLDAIGRRVRVGDKEGILRYIGPLHFDKGLWCGIELISGHGRNNGTVKGVPYFTCPDDKGLMAPVAKVTVIPASVQETAAAAADDNVSGPYSILCLPSVKPPENQKKRTNDTFTVSEKKEANEDESSGQLPSTYLPLNKSCEDLLKESTVEVKRRRTSICRPDTKLWTQSSSHSTPLQQSDYAEPVRFSLELSNIVDQSRDATTPITEEKPQKPTSLPQLRATAHHHFVNDAICDINETESNKRDSLDCDESLGILTPDQMVDFSHYLDCDKLTEKPSNRTAESRDHPEEIIGGGGGGGVGGGGGGGGGGIDSPNLTEYSLGIIDVDQMHCTFLNLNANAMNLDLSLSAGQTSTRAEETPSPEELPLDTTPIVDALETKNEPPKSKTNQNNNSFITSITSITSLDTGYQGDGEMSRPASRGADNSPLTKRPFPRAVARRPDPMTDSDFYTESDADNHEDNQLKGDRRAQVIDGTLYGVDPQAAADIYANNRENMDSSGVFTDLESGLRNDDQTPSNNVSPSESSKTISEDSQSNVPEPQTQKSDCRNETTSPNRTIVANKDNTSASKKRVASSPADGPSPVRHQKDQTSLTKKYKMPKRDVASKVKAMLVESSHHHVQQTTAVKKPPKKPANRWDHVMNKISKADQSSNKTNLKEVKSRVFEGLPAIATGRNSPTNATKNGGVVGGGTTTTNNQASIKSRRVRTRTLYNAAPALKKSTRQSSIHSSMSDLSAPATSASSLTGSAKKKDAVQVTQVLTANRLTSKNQRNLAENKKNGGNNNNSPTTIVQNATTTTTTTIAEVKTKRTFLTRKEPKQTYVRESPKPTTKGGRTSPSVRSPNVQQQSPPVKPPLKKTATLATPRTAEALAVLVQHLVFNVGAFEAPRLARQAAKYRSEAQELRSVCERLEETLQLEKEQSAARYIKDRQELLDDHQRKIAQLTHEYAEAQLQVRAETEQAVDRLNKRHDDQLTLLRKELEKLQRSHEEALQILQEENDCIREQIDEKRTQLEQATHESLKLKSDYETKEVRLKEELELLRTQRDKFERAELGLQEKIKELTSENRILREQNDRLLSFGEDKDIAKQEVQSLRVVLELKQNEVTELRKALEEAKQRRHFLEGVEEKAATLQARCEDLEHQLRRKNEYEQTLIQEQQRLHEALQQEVNTSKRLHQHNEELMWKLEHNKEIVSKVIEQAEETVFNRSSCNEKHHLHQQQQQQQQQQTYGKALERALSFREQRRTPKTSSTAFDEEEGGGVSPPTSPKVKGVVEKSDSVSYVLDLDESPDLVASRILRRSFRNTTPPKGASAPPAKSPSSNKRPRIRNALSTSASSSALHSSKRTESERPHSATPARNGYRRPDDEEEDEEEDEEDVFLWDNQPVSSFGETSREKLDVGNDEDEVDLQLPALPSEMDKKNGALALPSPKRLAVDPAGCGDTSSDEDESTSSSSQL